MYEDFAEMDLCPLADPHLEETEDVARLWGSPGSSIPLN